MHTQINYPVCSIDKRDNFLQHELMKSDDYVCILGGGAVRGIAYIGAIKALSELGINCRSFAGSSVGAIFASLFALDCSVEEIKNIFYDFNFFMFKDLNFGFGTEFAFSKGDVFEEWIREQIEKTFYKSKYVKGENPQVTFKNLPKDLYICTTDLKKNAQFVFSKENTPDFEVAKAVRISACFPGLMKPVEYEEKLLVDGDLAQSIPVWKSVEKLLDYDARILEFRLEGAKENVNLKSFVDYLNSVYSAFTNFCADGIAQTYNEKDNFDYILIDTKNVLLLDFNLSKEEKDRISQNGYDSTIKYFKETLVNKKKKLLPLYESIADLLNSLKQSVKENKTVRTKKLIFEFFTLNSDNFDNLDENFIREFKNLKNQILKDISDVSILKIPKLNNKTEYIKIIQGLTEKCDFIIKDFKNYIEKF